MFDIISILYLLLILNNIFAIYYTQKSIKWKRQIYGIYLFKIFKILKSFNRFNMQTILVFLRIKIDLGEHLF